MRRDAHLSVLHVTVRTSQIALDGGYPLLFPAKRDKCSDFPPPAKRGVITRLPVPALLYQSPYICQV